MYKKLHLTLNNEAYIQTAGDEMGSLPVLTRSFMVELGKTLVPTLSK